MMEPDRATFLHLTHIPKQSKQAFYLRAQLRSSRNQHHQLWEWRLPMAPALSSVTASP